MEENKFISLYEYTQKNLVVPAYQRGYVWSKKDKDHVTKLLDDLVTAFNNKQKKFMQAVTVYEEDDKVNIVDGQQRTITFYLLLAYLNNGNNTDFTSLKYSIRKESNDFLQEDIKNFFKEHQYNKEPSEDEEYKDLYFFKKSLNIFKNHNELNQLDKGEFKKYILKYVTFLYIPIAKEHVKTTFTMMNGNKAQMRSDELIKAELLRLISTDESNVVVNRARVAKEWERWIQWWNQKKVKDIFHINNNSNDKLKELIILLFNDNGKSQNIHGIDLFFSFQSRYLKDKENALDTFNKLRTLQKKFEDIYNDPVKYNKAGFILKFHNSFNVLSYIIDNYKDEKKLDTLYYLSAVSTSFKQYEEDMEGAKDFYDYCQKRLNEASYNNNDEKIITSFLLLLNINIDNQLERKFDFNIINNQSIEHIFPQSKFKNSDENNNENTITSDIGHSIGNLVLLYGKDNSALNANSFENKKNILFDYSGNKFKFSIHLLDTIKEFSKSKWDFKDIEQRKKYILNFFDKNYKKIENDIKNFKDINDFIKNN